MGLKITNITQQPAYNKTTVAVMATAAAGGVWYGIKLKKTPLGVTGIAVGFAVIGLIAGVVFAQLNVNKNKADAGIY